MSARHTTALLVAILGLAACGSSGSDKAASSAAPGDVHTANVTVTAAQGCTADRTSFPAGGITFTIQNKDATAVSEIELLQNERIVGEKENLPAGFTGSFAVNVDAGDYTLYCPGAATDKTPLKVTGTATTTNDETTTTLFVTGTKQYAAYVNTQLGYLVATTRALSTALAGTDLIAAQNAYKKARPYYERIEPVAESFTSGTDNLDADIDARLDDIPLAKLTGFHRIEQGLFAAKSLTGLAPFGVGLLANVTKLQGLTATLSYQPYELANGAQELLDEVASSKITGEEERYSHIDLLDVQANDEGAEQAFFDLKPGLAKIDATLAETITAQFAALDTLVAKYRDPKDASGFVDYTTLTPADKKALAAAVKAVQEPLSRVASKVAH